MYVSFSVLLEFLKKVLSLEESKDLNGSVLNSHQASNFTSQLFTQFQIFTVYFLVVNENITEYAL